MNLIYAIAYDFPEDFIRDYGHLNLKFKPRQIYALIGNLELDSELLYPLLRTLSKYDENLPESIPKFDTYHEYLVGAVGRFIDIDVKFQGYKCIVTNPLPYPMIKGPDIIEYSDPEVFRTSKMLNKMFKIERIPAFIVMAQKEQLPFRKRPGNEDLIIKYRGLLDQI